MEKHLFEIFILCAERGMQVPFVVCGACANGTVICIRIQDPDNRDDQQPDLLAEHFEPEGSQPPLHVMVIDQTGKCALFTIEAEGGPVMH
jgi:hypothetical protein